MIFEVMVNLVKSAFYPVIIGLVAGYFVAWQARRNLTQRRFLDRVNFSLNIVQDGRLKIRTLIEKPGSVVFLNPAILRIVDKAAQETTEDDCLVPIKDTEDYWLCLNSLLNEISEKYSAGFLRQDMNSAVNSETYVMCLTCEVSDNIRTRKIRAMLAKKSLLENFPAEDPEVDSPSHTTRIKTLRQLSRDYTSGEHAHKFIEVELCM